MPFWGGHQIEPLPTMYALLGWPPPFYTLLELPPCGHALLGPTAWITLLAKTHASFQLFSSRPVLTTCLSPFPPKHHYHGASFFVFFYYERLHWYAGTHHMKGMPHLCDLGQFSLTSLSVRSRMSRIEILVTMTLTLLCSFMAPLSSFLGLPHLH